MNKNQKHWTLYVLKLEDEKYYVGITSNTVQHRFKQHKNGFAGAAWTKLHKPLSVLESRDLGYVTLDEAQYYENRIVREYINKYGIDNVRGGDISYTSKLKVFHHRIFDIDYIKDDWMSYVVGLLLLMFSGYFIYINIFN